MRRSHAQLVMAATATVVLAGCGSPGRYGASATGGSSASSGAAGSETIGTVSGAAGTHLTADHGRAVYLFDADTSGTSTCAGPCAKAWPPVLSHGAANAAGSAKAADLGTVTRSDGSTQVTYQGHPLYYYADDKDPQDTYGEGSNAFGSTWWLVTPDGTPLAATSSSSSGGGYGGGYGS